MILCVNSNKGGSLKTTTSVNLSGVLARKGKKVLIIDTDDQSDVAVSFALNPDSFDVGTYEILVEGVSPEEGIVEVHENIDIIPSTSMVGFDFEVIGNPKKYPDPFLLMKKAFSSMKDKYDYIIIDTPPSMSLIVGNVFAFSDYVLMPYHPEAYSMRSLIKVVGSIADFKEGYNPNLELLGVFPTLVNSRTILHQELMESTRVYCEKKGIRLLKTFVPNSIRFASSIAYDGKPSTLVEGTDKSEVYFDLWEEVESIVKEKETTY